MAKVPFSKLKLKKVDDSIKTIEFEGQKIEVRQYLPIQDKLALIGRVVELAHEQDTNFSNPVKADVFTKLEMVKTYTNISFTDKQLEDSAHLYDLLESAGLIEAVYDVLPTEERIALWNGVKDSIEAFYKYQNSVLGLLDTINTDYSNLNFDLDTLKEKISDPEQLAMVKDVLTKLG